MIDNNTPKIVEMKLEKINALDAGLPSAMAPIKAINQIDKRMTGKKSPAVALLFTNWKILYKSLVSFAVAIGYVNLSFSYFNFKII